MKKFIVEHVGKSSSLSAGCGLERAAVCDWGADTPVKTPALWIGTRSGAIPSLTHETVDFGGLQAVPDLFAGLLVPMQELIRSVDVLQAFQKGDQCY
jgi:hypothetical protein